MRKVMIHQGKWWGAVNTGGTLALYYNKTLFKEANLDPERPPRTIIEWDAVNRALTKRDARGELLRAGHIHREPGWWSWMWGYHFGGSLWDATSDSCTADCAPNVAAYRWVQNTAAEFGHEAVDRFRAGFGAFQQQNQAFLVGKVAMVVQGPWMANQIKAFAPDLDYGVAPVPVDESVLDADAPIALVDTDMLMIPRGAHHPEASMEFIAYTQRQAVVEFLATAHCKGSPMAKASEEFLANHPNRGVRLHTALAGSPRAFVAPATPTWAEMKDIFDSSVDEIWKGQVNVEQRLGVVRARCQGALDRYAAQLRRRGEIARLPEAAREACPHAEHPMRSQGARG
jgi:ABC-type glycerol-3-phosphate transport system substrate-binding protein